MIVYVLLHWWDDGDGGQRVVIGVFSTLQGAEDAKAVNDKQLGITWSWREDEGFEIQEQTLDEVVIATLQNHKPVTK
jgi:hypothetical protein